MKLRPINKNPKTYVSKRRMKAQRELACRYVRERIMNNDYKIVFCDSPAHPIGMTLTLTVDGTEGWRHE